MNLRLHFLEYFFACFDNRVSSDDDFLGCKQQDDTGHVVRTENQARELLRFVFSPFDTGCERVQAIEDTVSVYWKTGRILFRRSPL